MLSQYNAFVINVLWQCIMVVVSKPLFSSLDMSLLECDRAQEFCIVVTAQLEHLMWNAQSSALFNRSSTVFFKLAKFVLNSW